MESNQASDWKRATDELIRGLESANQLLQLVLRWNGDAGSTTPSAEDLVRNILGSFTNSLFLLNTICQFHGEFSVRDSSCRKFKCPKSEDLEQSCNALTTKNRRGCYKRKRNIPTWTKETPAEVDDGHEWRKYGQKKILSVKYLRNYYRCTYKDEQGCQAIKQVQKIQEDPPLFHTTYYGRHTCSNLQYSDVILDYPTSPPDSSILLSFNNTPIPSKQDHSLIHSSPEIEA